MWLIFKISCEYLFLQTNTRLDWKAVSFTCHALLGVVFWTGILWVAINWCNFTIFAISLDINQDKEVDYCPTVNKNITY